MSNKNQILDDAFGNVDDRFIEKTRFLPSKKPKPIISMRGLIAACLTVALISAVIASAVTYMLSIKTPDKPLPPVVETPGYETVYEEIIDSMTDILQSTIDGADLPSPDGTEDDVTALMYRLADGRWPASLGYSLTDIDRNGVPEFIFVNEKYEVLAILTAEGGEAKILLDFSGDCYVNITEDGVIYAQEYFYIDLGYMRDVNRIEEYIYEISKDELISVLTIGAYYDTASGERSYYVIEKGEKREISANEWEKMRKDFIKRKDEVFYGFSAGEYHREKAIIDFNRFTAAPPFELTESKWYCMDLIGRFDMEVTDVTEESIKIELTRFSDDPEIVLTAVPVNGKYVFESDTISGYAVFSQSCVWFTVTESSVEDIGCMSYMYDFYPF